MPQVDTSSGATKEKAHRDMRVSVSSRPQTRDVRRDVRAFSSNLAMLKLEDEYLEALERLKADAYIEPSNPTEELDRALAAFHTPRGGGSVWDDTRRYLDDDRWYSNAEEEEATRAALLRAEAGLKASRRRLAQATRAREELKREWTSKVETAQDEAMKARRSRDRFVAKCKDLHKRTNDERKAWQQTLDESQRTERQAQERVVEIQRVAFELRTAAQSNSAAHDKALQVEKQKRIDAERRARQFERNYELERQRAADNEARLKHLEHSLSLLKLVGAVPDDDQPPSDEYYSQRRHRKNHLPDLPEEDAHDDDDDHDPPEAQQRRRREPELLSPGAGEIDDDLFPAPPSTLSKEELEKRCRVLEAAVTQLRLPP